MRTNEIATSALKVHFVVSRNFRVPCSNLLNTFCVAFPVSHEGLTYQGNFYCYYKTYHNQFYRQTTAVLQNEGYVWQKLQCSISQVSHLLFTAFNSLVHSRKIMVPQTLVSSLFKSLYAKKQDHMSIVRK